MDNDQQLKALGLKYAANVATQWPEEAHAKDTIDHLPPEIKQMLKEESDGFVAGWYNATAMVHDMVIKILIGELVKRTGGVAGDERDILTTRVGAVVEGLCYLACKEAVERGGKLNEAENKAAE